MTAAIPRREPTSTHLVALSLQACGVLPSPTHGDQELPNSKASPILKCRHTMDLGARAAPDQVSMT